MRDLSQSLFFTLFEKEGSLSLEKTSRILDVSVDGEIHHALNDARLLFLCYRAVVKGEIPSDRLSMARDELLIREAYHRGRRFEEPKSGMSQEKKEEAPAPAGPTQEELLAEIRDLLKAQTETGK